MKYSQVQANTGSFKKTLLYSYKYYLELPPVFVKVFQDAVSYILNSIRARFSYSMELRRLMLKFHRYRL